MSFVKRYPSLIASFETGEDAKQAISSETEAALAKAMGLGRSDDETAAELDALAAAVPDKPRYGRTTRCFIPEWLEDGKVWGIACQLYELRTARSAGIGDFEDLAKLAEMAGQAGADFLGVTPLHALFLANPERASPFSPSNRRFLNPLYIALDKVPGLEASLSSPPPEQGEYVDYAAVARYKIEALRSLWQDWSAACADREDLLDAFEHFRTERGEMLTLHALFEAISLDMVADGFEAEWTTWPEVYRSPEGKSVQEFRRENAEEVAFHEWLQWLSDYQLADAARRAREAGMRIGLYLDMAVGEAPGGSATWSKPEDYVANATAGAPPDYFSAEGQGWGVAGFSPLALWQKELAPFLDLVRGASRHAGALRIDHAMALWQLFFIPADSPPSAGAYLRFPIEDMVERLARLSNELGVMMIGEDLGHVPEGFREAMTEAGILSNRILYFEKDESEQFLAPESYPRQSLACLSTHDLPTLRGWWAGKDVDLRLEYRLIDAESADEQSEARDKERIALIDLLGGDPAQHEATELPRDLVVAAHRKLARSAAMLVAVRLADIVGEDSPTNLPGTDREFPNWRRVLPLTLDEIRELPLFLSLSKAMREERPRP